jgi:sec-independent protein translocase protein TatA
MLTDILQPTHLIFLLVIVLLFLGPRRLPDAGRALGHGLREFRSSLSARHEGDSRIAAPAPSAEDPGSNDYGLAPGGAAGVEKRAG